MLPTMKDCASRISSRITEVTPTWVSIEDGDNWLEIQINGRLQTKEEYAARARKILFPQISTDDVQALPQPN